MRLGKLSIGLAAVLTAGGVSTLQARQAPSAPHVSLVDEYCLSCHDKDHEKGRFVLEDVIGHDVSQHPEVWEKVVRKLRARQMPPIGKERPDDAAYDAVVASLEASLDRAAAAHPNPGRTATFRRLNRTEYQNAIRDLLALDIDAAALLPADESSYGFDNVTVGDLSPTLLDRYISAAQKISRLAVGRPARSPGGDTIRIPAGPHAGGARRGAADRHSRRRADPLHIPAGRRVRDPDPPDARPQRARRRGAASRTIWSCCWIASACSCSRSSRPREPDGRNEQPSHARSTSS